MKHSVEQILQIIYVFYPRGMPQDDPRWPDTAESRRLVDARLRAGAERNRWEALLARLRQQFDGCKVYDGSLHLISGNSGACYSAELTISENTSDVERHVLGFVSSFLVPYYAVYSYRRFRLDPATLDGKSPATRLDADESELSFWRGIATEIENTYGNELMPADVGHVIVQDVMPCNIAMGDAMIYDCVFSGCHRLVSRDDEFDLLLQKGWAEEHGNRAMWSPDPDSNGPESGSG